MNTIYKTYALGEIADAIEEKLYDPLWTDMFGYEGTQADIECLKREINKVVESLWLEHNKLKYDLENTPFKVYPVHCKECNKIIDFDMNWNELRKEYIKVAVDKGNALIEGKLYCGSCAETKNKKATGLIGEYNPMLAHKLWSVTCCNLTCYNYEVLAEFKFKKDAEEMAKKGGYKKIEGKWYCPNCSENFDYYFGGKK